MTQSPTTQIVLASTSPFRRQLLTAAGIDFIAEAADIDERAIEAGLSDEDERGPVEVARALAVAKAHAVSPRHPGKIVIGSDQTLSLDERIFHKPANRAEAREHLQAFSGKTHQLNSGFALVRDGRLLHSNVIAAKMTVRVLSETFIEAYLDRAGDDVLRSVGAYQIEGLGIQLFSHIEGDHFTIVGLPLLPLLAKLRELGALDA